MNKSYEKKHSVLAISYFYPPNAGSGSLRNAKILKHFPRLNWDLHVLTLQEEYFAASGESGKKLLKEIPAEANVIRTKFFHTQKFIVGLKDRIKHSNNNNGSLIENKNTGIENNKIPKMVKRSFSQKVKDFVTDIVTIPDKQIGWFPYAYRQGKKLMRTNQVDIIYAIGKPWTGFFVGYWLKKKYNIPLVIDFMDPWRTNLWTVKKNSMLEKIQNYLEKFIVHRADFVIANTEESRRDIVNRLHIENSLTDVVSCGYDSEDFKNLPTAEKNEKLTITHTGTFYLKRNPYSFLKALKELIEARKIDPQKVEVNFIGINEVNEPRLTELLENEPINKLVNQQNWVPHDKALEYMRNSDLLLLIQPDTTLQIPGKLYEYLATGKPVLALSQSDGAVANLIKKEKWGAAVDTDDIENIKKAIFEYYRKFMSGQLYRENEKINTENYEVGSLAKRLTVIFSNLISKEES